MLRISVDRSWSGLQSGSDLTEVHIGLNFLRQSGVRFDSYISYRRDSVSYNPFLFYKKVSILAILRHSHFNHIELESIAYILQIWTSMKQNCFGYVQA